MAHAQPAHAKEAFSKSALAHIASAIAEAEQQTHAEIRVAIHDERDSELSGKPIADVAKAEFTKLKMHETSTRNGLLLLVLYSERKFYIYADVGIHSKVQPETWTDVASGLAADFKQGHFEEGIVHALAKVTDHLRGVLSAPKQTNNELTNEVSLG